jgi:hypothetical protein
MPWIAAGASLVGGYMQGQSAKSAANTAANAQLQSAQIAADAQKFRPVGVTSNFGTSNFQFDPNGYLTGAGYTLDPRLQGVQSGLLGNLGQTQEDVSNIQNMGRQYMAQSPQEAAQQYMDRQQALLAPSRQQAQANLNTNLFNQGTGGLSVAQAGGGMSNPQQQAAANAQALQDLQLAAQAQQAGQQQYTFGTGLLSGAYSPLQTQLGTSQLLEQLGQTPLDIGAQLGGRTATAGANVGQSLLSGGMAAANSMYKANAYSPVGSALSGLSSNQAFTSGLGNYFSPNSANIYGNGGQGQVPTSFDRYTAINNGYSEFDQ